ncbi:hypothetical protein ACSBR1_003855 [Camellia fascicularis]
MFKADLPGLKKEEVKVEIEEDDRVFQISSEKNFEKEEKNDTWHRVQRSSAGSRGGSGCRKIRKCMRSRHQWRTEYLPSQFPRLRLGILMFF